MAWNPETWIAVAALAVSGVSAGIGIHNHVATRTPRLRIGIAHGVHTILRYTEGSTVGSAMFEPLPPGADPVEAMAQFRRRAEERGMECRQVLCVQINNLRPATATIDRIAIDLPDGGQLTLTHDLAGQPFPVTLGRGRFNWIQDLESLQSSWLKERHGLPMRLQASVSGPFTKKPVRSNVATVTVVPEPPRQPAIAVRLQVGRGHPPRRRSPVKSGKGPKKRSS